MERRGGGDRMLFSELKTKDVINIKDCRKLGRIRDLEFDECKGCICKVMISQGGGFLNFLHCEPDVTICWKDIRQIGPDIILVDISTVK